MFSAEGLGLRDVGRCPVTAFSGDLERDLLVPTGPTSFQDPQVIKDDGLSVSTIIRLGNESNRLFTFRSLNSGRVLARLFYSLLKG